MRELIANCGLGCEKCEAYVATQSDDDNLRRKVARKWSELNGVGTTPESINCDGCRTDGRKAVYCDRLCQIRQCAMSKGMGTCGGCYDLTSCKKVAVVIGNNQDALSNLRKG